MIKIFDSDIDNIDKLIGQKKVIVLYFSASWCGPCKRMHSPLEELSELYADRLTILKIDVDDYSDIADDLGIKSLPTFLFYNGGELKYTTKGANIEEFNKNLNSLL